MNIMILFIFLLGLFIGSFLNVLVDRLPRDESVLKGRSHCEKCKKELAWYDLIPVLSFVLLKGKCRYCHNPLSFYYPVVELITGSMFVLVFLFQNLGIMNHELRIMDFVNFGYYIFLVCGLIAIFFADLKYGIIPDAILIFLFLVSLLYLFIIPTLSLNHFLSGIGALFFFLVLFLVTRGKGMGFGDVKFSFLMGLVLGFPGVAIALYIAFLTGAVTGSILIIWRKKRLLGGTIPFGPFLVLGTVIALFYSTQIIRMASPLLSFWW